MAEAENKSKYGALSRPEHQSLADIAYNALVNAIINQDFEPGAQLSIDGLAKQLAMSNTPVREALMRANGERLVRQRTNHGFVVADLLTAAELHQMFELRHMLETHALAASDPESGATLALRNTVERMANTSDGAVYNDYKDYLLLDHDFHHILVGMGGNRFILKAWEDLHVHLHLSRLYTGVGLVDGRDSIEEHWAIVHTLEQRDKAEAVQLLSNHIKRVESRLETFLQRRFRGDNIAESIAAG
jgi:DNA-binding GntR family transcriptional regulator